MTKSVERSKDSTWTEDAASRRERPIDTRLPAQRGEPTCATGSRARRLAYLDVLLTAIEYQSHWTFTGCSGDEEGEHNCAESLLRARTTPHTLMRRCLKRICACGSGLIGGAERWLWEESKLGHETSRYRPVMRKKEMAQVRRRCSDVRGHFDRHAQHYSHTLDTVFV